jgi:DNA-binding SARP family transcriptional activator
VEFLILGRLAALDGGVDVTPRRAQPRALLATFLLHANQPVSTDRLIEAIWGQTPPPTAEKALQGHISALRKAFGAQRIRTSTGSYRFEVAPGELDAERFAAGLAAAREQRDARIRSRALSDALALWRGEVLGDLPADWSRHPSAAGLDALRLSAQEAWAEAELRLGRHAELAPELERLLARNPLSEGLRASLMLALYRADRQSDALRTYREGRLLLADELGIDPGQQLQELERRILGHDPTLAAPAPSATAPRAIRQERKNVTVMVVEAVSREPSSDAEEAQPAADPLLYRIRTAVERLGGRAEPLFANAVVGMFGAPKTREDDALRAVRAALEILADAASTGGARVRGGIETGDALVTIDGPDVSVTGQVLAAASRLQATAPLGSIVVGRATYLATADRADFVLTGTRSWTPVRLLRDDETVAPPSPFVGRAAELAQLERIAARARDEASVQLVTLIAEPGGGKSRLAGELRARLDPTSQADGTRWLQGRCLPYGDGVTFWALGEIVKDWSGILESDDAATSAARLAEAIAGIEATEAERTWLERSVGPLVGIDGAAAERELAFAAWRQLIEAIAGERPTILVFEDLHWGDEAFLAFIDELVDRAAAVPLLVLCTARPELLDARPGWAGGKRNATNLLLPPLNDADTSRLFEAVLGHLPGDAWLRRAGGNPLYARELAGALARSDAPAKASIPASLQAVVAAHLDALAPSVKAIAADASVIGEVFWPGAVAEVGGHDVAEVDPALQRLVANEVVRRRRRSSVAGADEYEFSHALVRDVAYGQLPARDRVAKHRAAAAWIERLAGDRIGAHAELLAHHAVQAFEIARGLSGVDDLEELRSGAFVLLARAGDAARRLDVAQAASLYRRALEIADPEDPERPAVVARLGEVAQLTGDLDEAEQLTREAIAGMQASGEETGAATTMVVLESVLWRLGRSEQERAQLLAAAIRSLERGGPTPELVQAYAQQAAHALYAGRSAECGRWSAKAREVAEAIGSPALKTQPTLYLGIARFESGDVAGIEDVRAAIDLGLQAGLSWETGHAMSDLGAIVWLSEGPAAGLPLKQRAVTFADSRGMAALARTTRAQMLWLLYDAGAWDELMSTAEALIAGSQGREDRIPMIAQSAKARVLVERGELQAAVALEDAVLTPARAIGDLQDLAPALATSACIRAAAGDAAGALGHIAEAEELTRGRDVSPRVSDLAPLTRICARFGAPELAARFHERATGFAPARARLMLAASGATLAELGGALAEAERRYLAAAEGWAGFGSHEEEAYARIGAARCMLALGHDRLAMGRSLGRARQLAAALGAGDVLTEVARLETILST